MADFPKEGWPTVEKLKEHLFSVLFKITLTLLGDEIPTKKIFWIHRSLVLLDRNRCHEKAML